MLDRIRMDSLSAIKSVPISIGEQTREAARSHVWIAKARGRNELAKLVLVHFIDLRSHLFILKYLLSRHLNGAKRESVVLYPK